MSSLSRSQFKQDGVPDYDPPMFTSTPSAVPASYKLQVELNKLFDRNKASLAMYDEIINLFNDYVTSPEFSQYALLQHRQQFMSSTEKIFGISSLSPKYSQVQMMDNTIVTVPVFDARAMILSLLHDPTIMWLENLADGYNIFTGAELEGCDSNNMYGEIHTGDTWKPVLARHCGKERIYMPVALVLLSDKSHMDLHSTLSVEPVSFTLSLFNSSACNLPNFWRLLGYIQNLSAGKGKANRMSAKDKIQNQHNCLSAVPKSIRDNHERGGIRTTVMGRDVHIKVWIHYIIGDTEGNNKWMGNTLAIS